MLRHVSVAPIKNLGRYAPPLENPQRAENGNYRAAFATSQATQTVEPANPRLALSSDTRPIVPQSS